MTALLALSCAAMLCGVRSYSAIAEWGRNYGQEIAHALGFTGTTMPCAATLFLAFRGLDRAQVEAVLSAWAEAVLAASLRAVTAPLLPLPAVALDGKTLRGSHKHGAPGAHLLAAFSEHLGLTLGQLRVADKTNEIGAAPELLRGLVLEGRVFTMDALLTQRTIAQTRVTGGGHYVLVVKGNQPQLEADLAAAFRTPPPAANRPGRVRRRATTGMGATNSAR